MDQSGRGSVLVIGSGYELFRRYLLAGVARRATVVLLDASPPGWQRPYLLDGRQVDLTDRPAVLAAAGDMVAAHGVDAVLTWDEKLVAVAAEVGAELGIATMPVHAARACRDKLLQREVLARAGVPSARSMLAGTPEQARTAAAELGYPVVVKPRAAAASVAVRVAADDDELSAAVDLVAELDAAIGADYESRPGVLVEELLRGREISVDAWVLDGEVGPLVVAHKRVGFPPYFVETGHVVGAPLEPTVLDAVLDVVTAANRALGVDRCITHTEVMLTDSGPRVVEVNGRIGGDLIPYVGELVTPGLSVGEVAATVAQGIRPEQQKAPDRVIGIHFVYPGHDMVFQTLSAPDALRGADWVVDIRQVSGPGTELRLPPRAFLDRAGYCLVGGEDLESVSRRLDEVAARVVAVGAALA